MFFRTRAVITLATVGLAACATAMSSRGPVEPTLAQTIDDQIASEDGITWTARRLLTWADFKGAPPNNPGSVAAETAYTIIHGARCVGSQFEYRVVAAFRPRDSWVRHAALRTPADSTRALRHEQTHFDLSEVHARRLRRYLGELYAPCRLSASDLSNGANRIIRDEKAAQAEYDGETDHGRAAAVQARWDKDVDSQLVALGKYLK